VESIITDIRDAAEVIEKDGSSDDAEIRLALAQKRHGLALVRLSDLNRVLVDDRKAVDAIRKGMLNSSMALILCQC
jgi:hypothetical protein